MTPIQSYDSKGDEALNDQPIDPDTLTLFAEFGPPPPEPVRAADQTGEELREGMRDSFAVFTRGAEPIEVHGVADGGVTGRHGNIPVRIYSAETPTAVIVYMHGGGWVGGDIETHDLLARRLCRDTESTVVSVDYRMLPEHPFPAPFDDAYEAAEWASALRPERPFLVAGDSAGGTLAACVALKARDEDGPRIDAQVLVYPGIDDDFDAPSMITYGDGPPNTRDDVRFLIGQYAQTKAALDSPYALPARATSLEGLPPAVIAIAGNDLLRSSVEEYVRRLRDAGVPVVVQFDPELTHSWVDYWPRVPAADRAFARLSDSVNELIGASARE